MGMEFFKKKRRVSAMMKNAKGRGERLKAGSGREGARTKVIAFEFEIPITSKIRETLDPKIQALVSLEGNKEGAEREFPINSIDPTRQVFPAIVKAFSKSNHSGKDEEWSQGGADKDAQASICLKKIVVKDNRTIMVTEVKVKYTKQIWSWAGEMLDGGEFVLAFEPLQGELFQEDDEDDEDVRPKALKDKEAAAKEAEKEKKDADGNK